MKSLEYEDISCGESSKNCHELSSLRAEFVAKQVEIEVSLPSCSKSESSSKFDYPIVRHHPLFAKTRGMRSRTISSLLVGENVLLLIPLVLAKSG